MKIVLNNRNEIKMEKNFHSLYGASAFIFTFGILSALLFFHEDPNLEILSRSLFLSYFLIILSIILLSLAGKKIITFSKMTGELIIENNRNIRKNKKKYLLKEIECIKRKNKRQFKRNYGRTYLFKVARYYLCLKDSTLIYMFNYIINDNVLFISKNNRNEKKEILNNLDALSKFLDLEIKSK